MFFRFVSAIADLLYELVALSVAQSEPCDVVVDRAMVWCWNASIALSHAASLSGFPGKSKNCVLEAVIQNMQQSAILWNLPLLTPDIPGAFLVYCTPLYRPGVMAKVMPALVSSIHGQFSGCKFFLHCWWVPLYVEACSPLRFHCVQCVLNWRGIWGAFTHSGWTNTIYFPLRNNRFPLSSHPLCNLASSL